MRNSDSWFAASRSSFPPNACNPPYAPQSVWTISITRFVPCSRIEVRTCPSAKLRSYSSAGEAKTFAPPAIFSGSAHWIPRFLRNLRVTSSNRASKHETTQASARYTSVCESKWKIFFTVLPGAAGFDFFEQFLDLVLLLQSRQFVFDIVVGHLGLGFTDRLRVTHLALHSFERRDLRLIADRQLRVARLGQGPRPSMLGDQRIALRFGLSQFLFQFVQGRFQIVDLRLLIRHQRVEAPRHLLVAHRALEGCTREIILFLVHGQFGFAHPFGLFLRVLFLLFFQHVLVGDGDGHLGLYLHELVSHIQDHLFDHFLGIFGSIDQIVQVGPDQCGYSL